MSLIQRATPSSSSISCYTLNGQRAPTDLSYIPCNTTAISNGQHSSCCASTDLCLSNGLCKYNAPSDARPFNEYWRVGCTDSTYQDPACPKQCANIPAEGPTNLVFQCPGNGRWCCGTGALKAYKERGSVNTTCCAMDDLAFDGGEARVFTTASLDLKMNIGTTSTAVMASTSASSTPTLTTPVAAASGSGASSENQSSSPSRNLPVAVGIGVGVPVAVAVIIGFVVFLILRKRRKSNISNEDDSQDSILTPGTQSSFWKEGPPAPITVSQAPSKPSSWSFWRRRREEPPSPVALDSPDIRTTNPHAFWNEAHGREMAIELDTAKTPVEAWSPDAEGKPWVAGGARGSAIGQRMIDARYGDPRNPELPAYAYR